MREANRPGSGTGRLRRQRRVLLLAVAWVLAGAAPLWAQLAAETARVATLEGRVSIERSGELWVLMSGQTVSAGQVVVTGPDGYVQLELSDQSTIEVFPNSRLIFQANRFSWRDLVDLYLGKIRLRIQHLTNEAPPYRITSPTAVISVRGTAFEVEVDSAQETTIRVEDGSVGVRHRLLGGGEVVVESGQSLQVVPNVPLAAAKATAPLVVAGRIAKIIGETLARVQNVGGKSAGNGGASGGGSAPGAAPSTGGGSPAGSSGSSSGGDAGSNEPAPVPGEDGTSAPPGDVVRP